MSDRFFFEMLKEDHPGSSLLRGHLHKGKCKQLLRSVLDLSISYIYGKNCYAMCKWFSQSVCLSVSLSIYIYYMVVSVTLGFMLSTFVRMKVFKKNTELYGKFLVWSGALFACTCAHVCVLLNITVFVYVLWLAHTYIHISAYDHPDLNIYTHIFGVCW